MKINISTVIGLVKRQLKTTFYISNDKTTQIYNFHFSTEMVKLRFK